MCSNFNGEGMRIFFEQIKLDGNLIETSFEFDVDEISFSVKKFKGKIYPIKGAYILEGDISLTINDKCDRCLKIFHDDFEEKITVEIVRNKLIDGDDEVLNDEDMGYYSITEDFIDIHEILYQESVLLRPMKRVCSEECKGLCPTCGKDLNLERCDCSKELDDRWKALTKLLQKQ